MTAEQMNRRADMDDANANILLVDDNPSNLRYLAGILANQGYDVSPTKSGEMALTAIGTKLPELILLDIRMPGMSGYEVCERLKADENTRTITVIFISAMDEVLDKVKGFSLGAVGYITKPFQEQEVLARVEAHLKLRRLQKDLQEKNVLLQQEITKRMQVENALRDKEHIIESALNAEITDRRKMVFIRLTHHLPSAMKEQVWGFILQKSWLYFWEVTFRLEVSRAKGARLLFGYHLNQYKW